MKLTRNQTIGIVIFAIIVIALFIWQPWNKKGIATTTGSGGTGSNTGGTGTGGRMSMRLGEYIKNLKMQNLSQDDFVNKSFDFYTSRLPNKDVDRLNRESMKKDLIDAYNSPLRLWKNCVCDSQGNTDSCISCRSWFCCGSV